ncbi:MAG: hypothetical protein QG632_286 [Candidatus Dependentiae bacterium]|nr:hypothetical protein [Candidatus Dependentiae bacterium]
MFKSKAFAIALTLCAVSIHTSSAVTQPYGSNEIKNLAPKNIDITRINKADIISLTPTQIQSLSLKQLQYLRPDQISFFTKAQMPFFSGAQLANVISGPIGTPETFKNNFLLFLTAEQFSGINPAVVKAMINDPSWLLLIKKILPICVERLNVVALTAAELEKSGFIPVLSAAQLATKLNATGKSAVESLSETQRATANQVAIRQLPAPIAATVINYSTLLVAKQYTSEEIAQLALIVSYFDKTKFQGLPGELIAQLPTAAFDPSQTSAPYNRNVAGDARLQPSWLTDAQIKALSASQITSLRNQISQSWPTPAQIPFFRACKELSGAFLENASLSGSQLKAITSEQLSIMAQSITSRQIQMNLSYFTQSQQLMLGAEIKKANRYDEIRNGITMNPSFFFDMLGWPR